MKALVLFLLIILISCRDNKEIQSSEKKPWSPPVISSTIEDGIKIDTTAQLPTHMVSLGKFPDSTLHIKLDFDSINSGQIPFMRVMDSIPGINAENSILIVDYNQEFIQPYEVDFLVIPETEGYLTHKKFYEKTKRLPVYIKNQSSYDFIIEMNEGRFIAIQEAIDSVGNWQPVEIFDRVISCGYSLGAQTIKPNHYLLTSIEKFNGSLETKLRLKLVSQNDTLYSNEYIGRINPEQLKNSVGCLGNGSYLR